MCSRQRSSGGPAGTYERERQEDEETPHHLLQPAATAAQQTLPEDSVPGTAGEGGTGGQPRSHSDPGEYHSRYLLNYFNLF